MARHYYDLWYLLRAGVGGTAMANRPLFSRVAEHREIFFRYAWVDYSTHKPGIFRLSLPADHVAHWRTDYREMLGPMFEQLMGAAAEFEQAFKAAAGRARGARVPPLRG